MQAYVIHKQDSNTFGTLNQDFVDDDDAVLDEFEVDEGVMRATSEGPQIKWNEYVAIKRCGDLKSFTLRKREKAKTLSCRCVETGRSAPPPLKEEDETIRDERIGSYSLAHTDGAKAYRSTKPDLF